MGEGKGDPACRRRKLVTRWRNTRRGSVAVTVAGGYDDGVDSEERRDKCEWKAGGTGERAFRRESGAILQQHTGGAASL